VEQNAVLQERIGSAAGYFFEKINRLILNPIAEVNFDIDNKAVKKQLNDAVSRLEVDARIKYESLAVCLSGFRLLDVLRVRAEATIEKEKPKERRKVVPATNGEITHPALLEQLRIWRGAKASKMKLPAFGVLTQKALYELVNYLPETEEALWKINGIGKMKINRFGDEILTIIREYCEENGIHYLCS
jgi:superfamily II DNA helicase RecQ